MSHDACQLCGALEPVPYASISKVCERTGCPQRQQQERWKQFFKELSEPKQEEVK